MRQRKLGAHVASIVLITALAGAATVGAKPHDKQPSHQNEVEKPNFNKWRTPHGQAISAEQTDGKEVNWIMPGQRLLDPEIFG